jgi:hypothetical protein
VTEPDAVSLGPESRVTVTVSVDSARKTGPFYPATQAVTGRKAHNGLGGRPVRPTESESPNTEIQVGSDVSGSLRPGDKVLTNNLTPSPRAGRAAWKAARAEAGRGPGPAGHSVQVETGDHRDGFRQPELGEYYIAPTINIRINSTIR